MAENVDIPSLEQCRKLAEAGWPQRGPWCWLVCDGEAEECDLMDPAPLDQHLTLQPGDKAFAAPTLGEMLAFCRERGWDAVLSAGPGMAPCRVSIGRSDWDFSHGKGSEPANALAEALAEALAAKKEA